MSDLATTRRRNLLMRFSLFAQQEIAAGRTGSATAFAERVGVHPSLLSKLRGVHPGHDTRHVSEKTARQIEARLGLVTGWLDDQHDDAPLTSAEASFVEIALRAYRGADARTRRALGRRLQTMVVD